MGSSYLGRNFVESQTRSQSTDYGSTMGKKKSPSRAMAYTFPEMESFHQDTFPGDNPGPGPGGPGPPIDPAGNPCDGRVLWVQSQLTIPCGESEFPISTSGAVGTVKITYPEGTSGNTKSGQLVNCPTDEFFTIKVTDDCPGYSTITVWKEACDCTGMTISCGADTAFCTGSIACNSAITTEGQDFTVSGYTGALTWSVTGTGWVISDTIPQSGDSKKLTPTCPAGAGRLTVTDGNCCSVEIDLTMMTPLTITGASELTKPGTSQYSASGTVTEWQVTGTGASISQTGLLTLDSTACGMIEISVTGECGGRGCKPVRVTNNGVWCLISSDYYGGSCTGCSQCTWQNCNCDVVAGGSMTSYYGYSGCRVNSGGSGECSPPPQSSPCTGCYTCQVSCDLVNCFGGAAVWTYKENYEWKCSC